jgi:hypothetical protein
VPPPCASTGNGANHHPTRQIDAKTNMCAMFGFPKFNERSCVRVTKSSFGARLVPDAFLDGVCRILSVDFGVNHRLRIVPHTLHLAQSLPKKAAPKVLRRKAESSREAFQSLGSVACVKQKGGAQGSKFQWAPRVPSLELWQDNL